MAASITKTARNRERFRLDRGKLQNVPFESWRVEAGKRPWVRYVKTGSRSSIRQLQRVANPRSGARLCEPQQVTRRQGTGELNSPAVVNSVGTEARGHVGVLPLCVLCARLFYPHVTGRRVSRKVRKETRKKQGTGELNFKNFFMEKIAHSVSRCP